MVCSSICGQIVNKINIYQLPKKKASDEKCITKLATLAIFCCYVYLVCKAVWPDFFLFFFVYGGCCCLREISGIAVGLCKSFTVESDRVGLGNFLVQSPLFYDSTFCRLMGLSLQQLFSLQPRFLLLTHNGMEREMRLRLQQKKPSKLRDYVRTCLMHIISTSILSWYTYSWSWTASIIPRATAVLHLEYNRN